MFKKLMACTFVFSLMTGSCFAMDHSTKDMDMAQPHTNMNSIANNQEGKLIHSEEVKGYDFKSYLINMKEKMAKLSAANKRQMAMMNMGPMKSHHLMTYILDQKGQKISDAKVGYMVTAPDGAKQKTMTMAMSGGYGADVDLQNGKYTIMTKALVNGQKVINTFEFIVE